MAAMQVKAEQGYEAEVTSDAITAAATTANTTTEPSPDSLVADIATAVHDIDFKYLCCADCDHGPLGITCRVNATSTTRGFYIAQGRVRERAAEQDKTIA